MYDRRKIVLHQRRRDCIALHTKDPHMAVCKHDRRDCSVGDLCRSEKIDIVTGSHLCSIVRFASKKTLEGECKGGTW